MPLWHASHGLEIENICIKFKTNIFIRNYYVGATHNYGIHHFTTIQEAIDNASSGQTIIVGVYIILYSLKK